MKHANATSFKAGQSGNPKGRPPGIRETKPRNSVRAAWDEVTAAHPKLVHTILLRGLQQKQPGDALRFVELGARLTCELGADAANLSRPVTIVFRSNVDVMRLRVPLPPAPDDDDQGRDE